MDSMAELNNTEDVVAVVAADACPADGDGGIPLEMTTVMLKNMPSRCRRTTLIDTIHELGFEGTYDFLHHPMKRNKVQNYGYAVINFEEPDVAKRFLELLDGYQLKGTSGKRLTSSPAKEQGLEKNKLRFGSDADHFDDCSDVTQLQSLAELRSKRTDEDREEGEDSSRSRTASTRDSEADSGDNESSSSSEVQRSQTAELPPMRLPRRTGPASGRLPRAYNSSQAHAFRPRGHRHHSAQAFPGAGMAVAFVPVPVMMPVPAVAVPYFCSYGFPEIDRSVYLNEQYDD
eukprot:TRINITY_DN2458_c0_g1_i3.p1 TRINITY_DN2458_c0_g1~~TRINITY_DN2458_c0_g1_i3.p1  ORF type:complete len:312 (+),score=59.64 TRINITY_DN2458_c0_g1_i3:75-938(+)